jgi:hypothetical protein
MAGTHAADLSEHEPHVSMQPFELVVHLATERLAHLPPESTSIMPQSGMRTAREPMRGALPPRAVPAGAAIAPTAAEHRNHNGSNGASTSTPRPAPNSGAPPMVRQPRAEQVDCPQSPPSHRGTDRFYSSMSSQAAKSETGLALRHSTHRHQHSDTSIQTLAPRHQHSQTPALRH